MSERNHNECFVNCGRTDCTSPDDYKSYGNKEISIVYLSNSNCEFETIKDAAIDDIKSQPFF